MKRICYFECFSGASGDMLLGALLGAGIDHNWFINELKKLTDIKNSFEIKISKVVKNGITATDVEVVLKCHDHSHRGLNDITKIINSSDISEKAKDLAIKIFTNLAHAEAKVHNSNINDVHFHEVGAIDAIVDIVGFSILFSHMNIDKVIVSSVNTGFGFVKCAHGKMPIPAPATLEIIQNSSWPVDNRNNIESELLTPTGAAILTTIKDEYAVFPSFNTINSVSYGAGKKDFKEICNVVRLTIGDQSEAQNNENIWIIETNIDDMQPELYDFLFEKLLNHGVFDVFLTPVIMKKSRPANVLTVVCSEKIKNDVEKIIFKETSTFGIRSYKVDRTVLNREFKKISLGDMGEITVKIGKDETGKVISLKPEYEDCVKLAHENNIPLKEVYSLFNKHKF